MLKAIIIALNLVLMFVCVACMAAWLVVLKRWWSRRSSLLNSIVPARPRERPFWSVADALVMYGAMLVFSLLLMMWMAGQGWVTMAESDLPDPAIVETQVEDSLEPGQPSLDSPARSAESIIATVAASTLAGLFAATAVLSWLSLFAPQPWRKLGLTVNAGDIGLGLKAAVMLLPPVIVISAAVSRFIPYQHPVLDFLQQLSSPAVFSVVFLGTAIVTPLVEELLCRGLLQGALQGFADRSDGDPDPAGWVPVSYWPVVVASLVFAGMHAGQGAAPIPLFFLSLGLGYLYRQTGNLTAPIIVHGVLNGLTLVVEVLNQQVVPG